MNRIFAASLLLGALTVAPAARAQEAQPAQPAAAEPGAPDTAVLEGKLSSLEEQYAETKTAVSGLQKLKISGYLQARYAWQESVSYNASALDGTSAAARSAAKVPSTPSQSGFFIRRGRIKAVYGSATDWTQYALQLDVVPAGVSIKEGYATVNLPWFGLSVDAGLQLFPFGYEVAARSSADLDTLERAAVTRAYLGGEYDLGVAVRGRLAKLVNFKVGLFDGNGIDSGQLGKDNDQLKDVIGRAWMDFGFLTVGGSGWYGKTINYSRADDKRYDRYRVGADAQLYLDLLPLGGTALKGEYLWGRTTIGTAGKLEVNADGTFKSDTRNLGAGGDLPGLTSSAPVPTGSGWYVLVTQNLGPINQLAVRYERYDSNHTLSLENDTDPATKLDKVKIRDEVQVALHTYLGSGGKVSLAWYHPMNKKYQPDAPADPKADVLFAQVQAKF